MTISGHFDKFINSVDDCIRSGPDEPGRVLALRTLLTDALRTDEFVLACLDRVMDFMNPDAGVWMNPPLFSNADLDYSVRMIYWPPNYSNNPHQHNSWTVTGVLHNKLAVRIYAPDNNADCQLRIERSFVCGVGEVGYIYSPCIHSITNPSDTSSVSLHIFSALVANRSDDDGAEGDDHKQTVWYPAPMKGEILKGAFRRALTTHIKILANKTTAESVALLDKVFELGDLSVKLACIKALCRLDAEHAARKLTMVSNAYSEPLRSELISISKRVLKGSGQ